MSKTWSGTRKVLEQEMICESLKGRIQYFLTHYHGAPDNYGRFCVRVDGNEVLFANPYNENKLYAYAKELKNQRGISNREWSGKDFLYDDENRKVEREAEKRIMMEGNMDIWQVVDAIEKYLNSNIQDAIRSEDEVVRMFAVLDRRIGKRTLLQMKSQVDKQPEWLQFFYKLRIEAENTNRMESC